MASYVDLNHPGLVIELGAGTGAVTQILKETIPHDRLLVVERMPLLVKHLHVRFPDLNVIEGDAAHLDQLIPPGNTISAIVSSLPLRSLPQHVVTAFSHQLDNLLVKDSVYIQFTYTWRDTRGHHAKFLKKIATTRVWRNLPPARVDVFKHV